MKAYKEQVDTHLFPVHCFVNAEKPLEVHTHWHDMAEILLVLEGNARQQIDDNIFRIEEGDIVIIWNNQFHSTYTHVPCRILVIQFHIDNFFMEREQLRNIRFYDKINAAHPLATHLERHLRNIEKEATEKGIAHEYAIGTHIYSICTDILRNSHCLAFRQGGKMQENYMNLAAHILDYIDIHYKERITLSQAARANHLSQSHFMRIFKSVTGTSFRKYLNYYRVNQAEVMLSEGYNVTESAFLCGFSDVNTFIRNFKKYKKRTPSGKSIQ